jgi:hypothetical protein
VLVLNQRMAMPSCRAAMISIAIDLHFHLRITAPFSRKCIAQRILSNRNIYHTLDICDNRFDCRVQYCFFFFLNFEFLFFFLVRCIFWSSYSWLVPEYPMVLRLPIYAQISCLDHSIHSLFPSLLELLKTNCTSPHNHNHYFLISLAPLVQFLC